MPSSALNTPIMSPSMMRNAAWYCATFVSITFQAEMMTSTVLKLVSRISSSEMPSIPRR